LIIRSEEGSTEHNVILNLIKRGVYIIKKKRLAALGHTLTRKGDYGINK